jgi:hypothetical protein
MVAWSHFLLPIALSSVFVFFVSAILHMVLQWHKPDYLKLANEDEVRAAILKASPAPGQYILPHCADGKDAAKPEMKRKFEEGPVGVLFLRRAGPMSIGPFLMQWIGYTLVIGALVAYFAQFTLKTGATYAEVFRVVGMAGWLGYAWQGPSDSIWKGKPWISSFRGLVDGLVYALITAGTFAWLWPR